MEHEGHNSISELRQMRTELSRFIMIYQFAIDEITTKINILKEEFTLLHDYNPIEHVSSRVKSIESIFAKVQRKGITPSIPSIRAHLNDIAGVRITCSFISDTYRVFDLITSQKDVRLIEIKDYIRNPKPNGYKSLHAIIEIPVFLSTETVYVNVELQIRTIAMDFWASLEHQISYKYSGEVPQVLLDDIRAAAIVANSLDRKMEEIHQQVSELKNENENEDDDAFFKAMQNRTFRDIFKDEANGRNELSAGASNGGDQ